MRCQSKYLLVVYKQDLDVLAEGDRVGVTNHTILLAPDEYIIALSGDGYAPSSEDGFDDLCSDLDQLPFSVAVAASAAFPVALSPISLRNYSYEECKGAVPGSGWISAELTLPLPATSISKNSNARATPTRCATARTPTATNAICTCSMAAWSTIREFSR